jgi:aminoglycoside phosphotransferase (APT) family kinase protein
VSGSTGPTPRVETVPHGFADDARARVLRARPPAQAIAWVEYTLRAEVTRVRALKGGSTSALHALRVSSRRGVESVVMRRYVIPEVTDEEPDLVPREARLLQLLGTATVPVPRLVAFDASGAGAGVPTILMSRVPGRVDWSPRTMDAWMQDLAGVLPALHATPLPAAHGIRDFAPYEPPSWAAPKWMRRQALWERAVEIFHEPPRDPERVLVHRDFHPGNVLWRRGRVTGVVDWQAGSIGPSAVDVAWCRVNLIWQFDGDVADRFLRIWEDISGGPYQPWAEIVLLVDAIGECSEPTAQEGEDLERALAQRMSELGA